MRLLPLSAVCLIAAAAASDPPSPDPSAFATWQSADDSGGSVRPDAADQSDPGRWYPRGGPATREYADSVSRFAGSGSGMPSVDAWHGLAPVQQDRPVRGTELEDWLVGPQVPAASAPRRVLPTGVPEIDAWYGLLRHPRREAVEVPGTSLSDWLGDAAHPTRDVQVRKGHPGTVPQTIKPVRTHGAGQGDRKTGAAHDGPVKQTEESDGPHHAAEKAGPHQDAHPVAAHGDRHAAHGHGPASGKSGDGDAPQKHGAEDDRTGHGKEPAQDVHGKEHASDHSPALPPRPDTAFARAIDWEKGEAEILEYQVRLPDGEEGLSGRGRLVTERLFLRPGGTVGRRAGTQGESEILQASLALDWEDEGQPYSVQTVSQLPRRGSFSLLRQEQARLGGAGAGHRSLDCRSTPPRLRIASSGGEAPVDTLLPRWPVYSEEMLFTYLRAIPLKPGYREEAWIQDWGRNGRLEAKARYVSITVRARAPGVRDMDTWYLSVDREDGRRSEFWIAAAGLHPVVVARLSDGSEWSLKGISRRPQRDW